MGLLSILSVGDRGPAARRHRRTFTPSLMLGAENLESRIVLSHTASAVAAPAVVKDALKIDKDALKVDSGNLVITNIQLTGLNFDAAKGLLTATGGTVTGTLAGLPFTTNITNFALQLLPGDATTAACSVLNLELAPIHANLLGLHVDTSPICLDITAFKGQGVLGDLLCGIAGGNIAGLSSSLLTNGLSQVLAGALNQAQPTQGEDTVCTGECEILDLSVGPVDLNLLGVNVHLDDCDNGPVQVCVSATASEGLLGNLLCTVADTDLTGLANLTLKDIAKLVKKATKLLEDGSLSLEDFGKLLDELIKAVKK